MTKKIGVIFADTMEFAPFEKYAISLGGTKSDYFGSSAISCTVKNDGKTLEILAVESGIGKVCAAAAAGTLIAGFGAEIILNAGLSGAVSGCRRGDVVAGEKYAECDMDLTAIGYGIGCKPGFPNMYNADCGLLEIARMLSLPAVTLGTGDIFLTEDTLKQFYHKSFGISAFDMESAAIACVCHSAGVPFLSIRKISDDANDAAVNDYREMNDRAEESLTQVLSEVFARL